jgi:hypothetical protein
MPYHLALLPLWDAFQVLYSKVASLFLLYPACLTPISLVGATRPFSSAQFLMWMYVCVSV